jgi:predicted GNAT family N-acyltransferase
MNEELEYLCKTPIEATKEELKEFHRLVLEGGKVLKQGLSDRINNCVVLGFCKKDITIIGISAIKRPQKSYVEKVIQNAALIREVENLEYEIGYSYTDTDFRKKGISTSIKSNIIEWMDNIGGTVFSTTAIQSSQRFLTKKGFTQGGNKYDGKNDKNLKYFELQIKKKIK